MKYYTLVVKTYNNGTDDKTSLYTFETLDEARAMAHTQYGQNIGADVIASILAMVTNSVGGYYKEDTLYWAAPVVEPEPEPTPEEEGTSTAV